MKKKNDKHSRSWRRVHVPIWDCNVFVCVGDYEYLRSNMAHAGWSMDGFPPEEEILPSITGVAATICGNGCGANCVIWMRRKQSRAAMVHELCHACFNILYHKECQVHKGDAEEPFAYLMEWLYKELVK